MIYKSLDQPKEFKEVPVDQSVESSLKPLTIRRQGSDESSLKPLTIRRKDSDESSLKPLTIRNKSAAKSRQSGFTGINDESCEVRLTDN